MPAIPILKTKRLVLREWRADDFDAYADMMADAEVARFFAHGPLSRNDAWRNLAAMAGHWSLRGYGLWAVERADDGAVIGRAGLWNPEGWPGLEVGWALRRAYWDNGYATEAARATLAFGFETLNSEKILSIIHVDNERSQRIAVRLGETKGARRDLPVSGGSYAVDVWEITQAHWRASHIN